MNALDGCIELIECGTELTGERIRVGLERRRMRPENPEIQLAVEERDAQTRGRQAVAMRAGLPLNEAAEAEASEVVGHLRGGIRATRSAAMRVQDRGDESRRVKTERSEGLAEREGFEP